MKVSYCRSVLPLTAFCRPAFPLVRDFWRHLSPRNQREFNGSRPSIFPEGSYRTVRKRQSVSLTLPDHLFNFACQEMIDVPGIIDLAAAFEKLPSDLPGLREELRIGIVPEPS
jgi:hypothetical protein